MPEKFFSIERIKKAIEHLELFDSNWVIVPLVFAVNGVNSRQEINLNKRHGGDPFLNKHFSGSLIGLQAFDNGANTLRPRFADIYGNMKKSGREQDYVLHQGTKLWANVYSSRGYREMKNRGIVTGPPSFFKIESTFLEVWRSHLSDDFHFEELLVWLYAFSGLDNHIASWQDLINDFQFKYLGNGNTFEDEYTSLFRLNGAQWDESHFVFERPTNENLQKELYPSKFLVKERTAVSELNKIVYGPPGVGKSFYIKQEIQESGSSNYFITTFHPEYCYPDFIGSFRPLTENYGTKEQSITYRFRPEAFINAYVEAWRNPQENIFLVIEEINRGNPAAIFGDIFQLLDRDDDGYSEYVISCREEVRNHLEFIFHDTDYAERLRSVYDVKYGAELKDPYSILLLPSNFIIRATMNTSDQSLFPMDSAFKRRWTWQYMPISYDFPDRRIVLGSEYFSWNEFVRNINDLIYEILETEDKCLGLHFLKTAAISGDDFRNKVVFYLWNDILRDELPETKLRVFPKKKSADGKETDFPVIFNDFFDKTLGWEYVKKMIVNLGLSPLHDIPSV